MLTYILGTDKHYKPDSFRKSMDRMRANMFEHLLSGFLNKHYDGRVIPGQGIQRATFSMGLDIYAGIDDEFILDAFSRYFSERKGLALNRGSSFVSRGAGRIAFDNGDGTHLYVHLEPKEKSVEVRTCEVHTYYPLPSELRMNDENTTRSN
jgi:hypothetical protein